MSLYNSDRNGIIERLQRDLKQARADHEGLRLELRNRVNEMRGCRLPDPTAKSLNMQAVSNTERICKMEREMSSLGRALGFGRALGNTQSTIYGMDDRLRKEEARNGQLIALPNCTCDPTDCNWAESICLCVGTIAFFGCIAACVWAICG